MPMTCIDRLTSALRQGGRKENQNKNDTGRMSRLVVYFREHSGNKRQKYGPAKKNIIVGQNLHSSKVHYPCIATVRIMAHFVMHKQNERFFSSKSRNQTARLQNNHFTSSPPISAKVICFHNQRQILIMGLNFPVCLF